MEAKEIILKALKEAPAPLKSGDIAGITGLDKKIVSKELSKLKKEGLIISPSRCYYQVKE